jgi:hypothetical protein
MCLKMENNLLIKASCLVENFPEGLFLTCTMGGFVGLDKGLGHCVSREEPFSHVESQEERVKENNKNTKRLIVRRIVHLLYITISFISLYRKHRPCVDLYTPLKMQMQTMQ